MTKPRRVPQFVEPAPIVEAWALDDRWIRVMCTAKDCTNQGDIRVEYRGDINVDVDLDINNAWCTEHLPDHLRRRKPETAEVS